MLPGAGPCAGVCTRTAPDQCSPGHTHRAARRRETEVAGGGVAARTGRQGTGQVRLWEVGQGINASRDEHLDNFSSMLRRPEVLASLYAVSISQRYVYTGPVLLYRHRILSSVHLHYLDTGL